MIWRDGCGMEYDRFAIFECFFLAYAIYACVAFDIRV